MTHYDDLTADLTADVTNSLTDAVASADLETIYDNAPVGLCVLDLELRYVRVNQRLADINGLPAALHLGKTVGEVVPDLVDAQMPVFDKVLKGTPVQHAEVWGETPAQPGVTRAWLVSYHPLKANSVVVGINMVVNEITTSKTAQAELEQREELYRTMFTSIDQGFCVLEMVLDDVGKAVDYRFLETNPMFEAQTGLVGAVGKTARELVPDLEQHWVDLYGSVAVTGNPLRFENGSEAMGRWFDVYACRVGPCESRKVALVFADITARKQAETALAELNRVLEQRVAERTANLEAANRELEAFSYSVSHDLRAPLRGIDGFSQALVEDYGEGDALDATATRYLQRIRAGTQRMGELIDDLLTLSRFSRSKIERRRVNLSDLAGSVLENLKQRDPTRRVELRVQSDLYAEGDPRLLRIVFENLFENAWKFTRDKAVAHIAFGVNAEGVYFVSDDGAGFDMAYASKLFGAFQRLHSAAQFEGTGIGLAIVQRILYRHGGKVWAESVVGEGATFYLRLPHSGDIPPLPPP